MSGKIVRLCKSLYGLRQASRTFHKRLVSDLKRIGFEQSLTDPCILRFMVDNKVLGMVVIHVDDILFAGLKRLGEFLVQALGDSLLYEELGRGCLLFGLRVSA